MGAEGRRVRGGDGVGCGADAAGGESGRAAAAAAVDDVESATVANDGGKRDGVAVGGAWAVASDAGTLGALGRGRVETGYGTEVGAEVEYADTRLGVEVEARGRYLLAHRSGGFRERGASLALRFDPGGDGAGLWIALAPRWGTPESGVRSLWGSVPVGGGDAGSSSTLGLEAGYRYRNRTPGGMNLTVGLAKGDGASGSFGVMFRGRMSG